jgi:hypothetical protein
MMENREARERSVALHDHGLVVLEYMMESRERERERERKREISLAHYDHIALLALE